MVQINAVSSGESLALRLQGLGSCWRLALRVSMMISRTARGLVMPLSALSRSMSWQRSENASTCSRL